MNHEAGDRHAHPSGLCLGNLFRRALSDPPIHFLRRELVAVWSQRVFPADAKSRLTRPW
jgi:hypothetical protein